MIRVIDDGGREVTEFTVTYSAANRVISLLVDDWYVIVYTPSTGELDTIGYHRYSYRIKL